MGSVLYAKKPDFLSKSEIKYTVQYVAVKWRISDDLVRNAVKFLLYHEGDPEKKLIQGVDIYRLRRMDDRVRAVREYQQYRISLTGLEKIERYLFPSEDLNY